MTLSLLAQAVQAPFFRDHPDAAVWLASISGSALFMASVLAWKLWRWISRQFRMLEGSLEKLVVRLEVVETNYRSDQRRADTEEADVRRTAEAIDALGNMVSAIQLENVKAHGDIIQGRIVLIERQTKVEERLASLGEKVEDVRAQVNEFKKEMPNGTLKDVALELGTLVDLLREQKRRGLRDDREDREDTAAHTRQLGRRISRAVAKGRS